MNMPSAVFLYSLKHLVKVILLIACESENKHSKFGNPTKDFFASDESDIEDSDDE